MVAQGLPQLARLEPQADFEEQPGQRGRGQDAHHGVRGHAVGVVGLTIKPRRGDCRMGRAVPADMMLLEVKVGGGILRR